MSSLDFAVEDLAPSSSLRSRPIRWISFTLVRLLDLEGHHIPLFRPSFKVPFFIIFFNHVLLMLCNEPDEVMGTEREDRLVYCLTEFAF